MGAMAGGEADADDPLAAAREIFAAARERQVGTAVEGVAGGGAVRVTMSGERRVTGLTIDPAAFGELSREELEELIVAACSDAFEQAQQANMAALGNLTSFLGTFDQSR